MRHWHDQVSLLILRSEPTVELLVCHYFWQRGRLHLSSGWCSERSRPWLCGCSVCIAIYND
ncbi:hypothetical protein CERZMDRAFT_114757 [Cercospora zeae-maydis SCOH1-5]|uniref:Uncharacterized protein n=1 Tax=Cercospora zeae-maydis SCOH1-5 TaxID=717836 RepID=A0A6A6F4M4_9PEZI|nr:hypothetical protein CERZMDRAFT_114757 [Cercospora zeae-maydis SCOH1-5]